MSIYPPVHTTDAAVLPVEKVKISATSMHSTETIDAGSRKNVAVHEVHVDVTATIGPSGRTRPDDVDTTVSDDETRTSSPSDVYEHPDLPKETVVPNISIVQHTSAHIERTGETISYSSELPVEDVEKPIDDEFDINKILRDMIHAGLQPRGGGNATVATSKAITDPMKAGRGRGKEEKEDVEEQEQEKLGKRQKAETPKPKAKAEADKKASSKSGKK